MAVADNSVLTNYVDSGQANLLYRIVGCVLVPPSIIDPDPDNTRPEFNAFIHTYPDLRRAQHRRAYLDQATQLWVQAQLSPQEAHDVEIDFKRRFKRLKGRRGDLEALALAYGRKHILLTDDGGLRVSAESLGVKVYGSCGLLLYAAKNGFLDCSEAMRLYNTVFKEELNLYSAYVLMCDPPRCERG